MESKLTNCNHKTVFVVDHSPYFGLSCEDLMEFDLNKTRTVGMIPTAPISKSLWTCSVEATIEYCRITWDLFPEGKLVRFIASDTSAHHLNTWAPQHQNLSYILNNSALLGTPPRGPQTNDQSVVHGLKAAIESLTECSNLQHAKRASPNENIKVTNRCRVICILSTRDNSSMKSLQDIFLKALIQQNKAATGSDHLMPIQFCHFVIINIFPNTAETQVTPVPPIDLSPTFTVEIHSVPAGKGLSNKLSHLILGHYNLSSTTVTGIPMKEEQNASSSANYDVEIFHAANSHTDLFKGTVVEPSLIRAKKEGTEYETVTLKWCTPRGSSAQEMHNCTAAHRVTPVDVNSRPSSCLINFLLNGRSVMLEMPKRAGGKTISHILSAHGGEIFIHSLATGRSMLEDPPSISEGCGGRITDYRITDFGQLMKNNKLVPLQHKLQSLNLTEKLGLPLHRIKARLDRHTKYWPLTISGTCIFNIRQYIDPLPQLMVKEELTTEEVVQCKQIIFSIVTLENKHEPLLQPSSGTRGKGPKRDEQYKLIWNELEKFVRTHCRSDQHNKVLQCVLECRNKDESTDKVELDQALRELDVLTENTARASVIRATTDSPMSPPPVPSRSSRSTASTSMYAGNKTLLDVFLMKANNDQNTKIKRADFHGRSTPVATLYPNFNKDERDQKPRSSDIME